MPPRPRAILVRGVYHGAVGQQQLSDRDVAHESGFMQRRVASGGAISFHSMLGPFRLKQILKV